MQAAETGHIYRIAGGAPLYIGDCNPLGGCNGYVTVNQYTIDHLDHMNAVPTDATFLRAAESGDIYRVAGGAPLLLSSCLPQGIDGCPGVVDVNAATIASLAPIDPGVAQTGNALRSRPADGTLLRATDHDDATYVVINGVPVHLSNCDPPYNGCATAVDITQSAIDQRDHLNNPYLMTIDAPTSATPVMPDASGVMNVTGWAIDATSASGTGVDEVDVYLDGPAGQGIGLGSTRTFKDRSDVAAIYNAQFANSGYEIPVNVSNIAPGAHTLFVYSIHNGNTLAVGTQTFVLEEPTATAANTPQPATATNTPSPSTTPIPPTATPSNTNVPPTATPANTPIPTATAHPISSSTAAPTATDSPMATATMTPRPTSTATSTPMTTSTSVATAANTAAPTQTGTATDSPPPTATRTPIPMNTSTLVPTNTNTPVPTATGMPPTATPTSVLPATATNSPMSSSTPTPTATPPPTSTPIPIATDTPIPPAPAIPTATNIPAPPPPSAPPIVPSSQTPVPPPAPTTLAAPLTSTIVALSSGKVAPPTSTSAPVTNNKGVAPKPTATAAPASPSRSSPRPQRSRAYTPPLTMRMAGQSVTSGNMLTITIHTAPRARIALTLGVTTSRMSFIGTGKHRRRVSRTIWLYHLTGGGTADKRGGYIGKLRVSYAPAKSTRASLTVTARTARGVVTRTTWVAIQPRRRYGRR